MADPIFGIVFRRKDDEPLPVYGPDLSTIGLIGPCPTADPDVFPLNEPVKMETDDTIMATYLGESGYIPDALRAINDQLGEFQFAARVIIVRTEEGDDPDPAYKLQQTISKVMGNSLQDTGLFAFLKAPHKLGFTPRLIAAPGYTGQMANGIGTTVRTSGGSGYIEGNRYDITFSGGGENAVQATAHAFGQADGKLGFITLDTPGAWYTTTPTVAAESPETRVTATYTADIVTDHIGTITRTNPGMGYVNGATYLITISGGGGGAVQATANAVGQPNGTLGQAQILSLGSGYTSAPTLVAAAPPAGTTATFTCSIVAGANPVVAALPSVLNGLIGHAVVESSGISQMNDADWRETFQSERIIPITGGVRVMDPVTSDIIFRPAAPRVLGIAVRRDHEKGAPGHSWANQPVQGIIGPARDIGFNIVDSANEGQELLSFNIGIIVRGEIGVETAIASGGFVFVGTDNAGESDLWRFYNVTRMRDYIHLGLLRTLRYFLGRYNITGHTVTAILNTVKFFLRDLQADDHILGYAVKFTSQGNSAENIRKGWLTIGFKAEEPPVLRKIITESYRYRPAIDAMVSALEAQLNMAV